MKGNRCFVRQLDKLDNDTLSLEETLFHSANGYIGVRGALEEGYPASYSSVRGSYINGVYDLIPMNQAEPLFGLATEKQTLVNVADVQDIKLYVDGELCTPFSGKRVKGFRVLDMEKGFVQRELVWESSKGKIVRLQVKRMASFSRLPLFLLVLSVSIDQDAEVLIKASHHADVKNFCDPNDPRLASESLKHIMVDKVEADDRTRNSTIVSHVARSGIIVVTDLEDSLDPSPLRTEQAVSSESMVRCYYLHAQKGIPLTFFRYAVFTDSRRWEDPKSTARKILTAAVSAGPAILFQEQADYLALFWDRFDCEIEGDDTLSEALNFNMYQLLQSVGKDGISHLAAKGLSGEGYEGHYFWDTEMFVQPFFTLTQPELSRKLLVYRYSILPQARENARLLGHRKGALFPWRTISGKECSGFFPAGTAQYHIDGAIAYAIVMYYLVTGDEDFMVQMGLEMLLEIARLWYDLGTYVEGTFRLNCVTGPDEYTCLVNNNYYTNVSAKYDFHWAVKLFNDFTHRGLAEQACRATGITEKEISAFEEAEKAIYLPYDTKLDIIPQDDSFLSKKVWDLKETPKDKFPLLLHYHPLMLYRYQVCKQADTVLANFLYEDETSFSTMLNTFLYYERLTTHDSSLSTCIFSIMASRLGLWDKAYAYFGNSVEIDIHNTHGNTKDGIHTANMGGSYLAILFGFAGLRIKESGLYLFPFLPEAWKGYSFCLTLHGLPLKVRISREGVSLWLKRQESGQLSLYLYGQPIIVTKVPQTFPLQKGRKA